MKASSKPNIASNPRDRKSSQMQRTAQLIAAAKQAPNTTENQFFKQNNARAANNTPNVAYRTSAVGFGPVPVVGPKIATSHVRVSFLLSLTFSEEQLPLNEIL